MKISGLQIFWLFASFEFGMTALLTISSTVATAKQDAWMSFIIAGVLALVVGYNATKLSLLYPDKTFVEYCEIILGKWLGKFVVIPYLIMWYSAGSIVIRQSSDYISIVMFRRTPLLAIALLLMLGVMYATYRGGIEGIARCGEIMGPIIYITILVALILSISNVHFKSILPVYTDSGWLAILKGSYVPFGFLGEVVQLTMLVPFVSKPEKVFRAVSWGVSLAAFLTMVVMVMTIMTFEPSMDAKMSYPFFDMVRFVSLADFIQNIDALVVIEWVLSVFIKLSLFMFITCYGTAQWLNIKNWKSVIWFAAPTMVVLGMLYPNTSFASVEFPKEFWTPLVVPINFIGLPLLLWVIGSLRKRSAQS